MPARKWDSIAATTTVWGCKTQLYEETPILDVQSTVKCVNFDHWCVKRTTFNITIADVQETSLQTHQNPTPRTPHSFVC
jgi:hypothetical protein